MRYGLKTLIVLLLIAPIAMAWIYQTYFDLNEQVLPTRVLKKLDSRFEKIQTSMGEAEVLKTLQLSGYPDFLANHYEFVLTGGGSNHKIYHLSPDGHQLEFRDFMGIRPVCILHLPGKRFAQSIDVGESVTTMSGMHERLNPDLYGEQ